MRNIRDGHRQNIINGFAGDEAALGVSVTLNQNSMRNSIRNKDFGGF